MEEFIGKLVYKISETVLISLYDGVILSTVQSWAHLSLPASEEMETNHCQHCVQTRPGNVVSLRWSIPRLPVSTAPVFSLFPPLPMQYESDIILLPELPAFWLFPRDFCSIWTMKFGFYFTTAFPCFPLCCGTPHQGREAVPCPVTEELLCSCHWIIWKAGKATMGKQRCFLPVSQVLGRLLMSKRVSLKGQELPDPLFPR